MVGAALAIGLVHLFVPIVLAILAKRRWRTPWALFGAGAVAFVASKVVQIPLSMALGAGLEGVALSDVARLAIFLAFAPLCEEGARFVAFRATQREWSEGGRGPASVTAAPSS